MVATQPPASRACACVAGGVGRVVGVRLAARRPHAGNLRHWGADAGLQRPDVTAGFAVRPVPWAHSIPPARSHAHAWLSGPPRGGPRAARRWAWSTVPPARRATSRRGVSQGVLAAAAATRATAAAASRGGGFPRLLPVRAFPSVSMGVPGLVTVARSTPSVRVRAASKPPRRAPRRPESARNTPRWQAMPAASWTGSTPPQRLVPPADECGVAGDREGGCAAHRDTQHTVGKTQILVTVDPRLLARRGANSSCPSFTTLA